jgi:hypothetical protein
VILPSSVESALAFRSLRSVTCACGIVSLALAIGIGAASAQEMRSPRISPVRADWDALAQELQAIEEAQVNQSRPQGSLGERLTADGFRRVNSATGERFANIAASPVPVLLPFNTLAFLRDRADGAARDDAEN